uniref:Reverse transcriptase domain-containing protein n=1 Tax=Solanum lycopersicum TaxID=4081 RepID=A0A3Q7EY18_SOLLC
MYYRVDLISVRLLNEAFMKLSRASGLQANTNKSSLYMAEVADHIKQEFLDELDYIEGNCPLRGSLSIKES